MSNRLTFSLASLILIFAFAAMPAMADPGGPTVSITPYTGKNAETTPVDHVQTRADFRVKVEFSHIVTDPVASNFTLQTAESETSLLTDVTAGTPVTVLSAASPGSGTTGVPATELTANKVYVLILDLNDTNFDAGYMAVRIAENQVTGAEAAVNGIGNQAGSFGTSNLPKSTAWTVTLALDESSLTAAEQTGGKLATGAIFDVKFTLTPGAGAQPNIDVSQLRIDGDAIDSADFTISPASGAISFTGVEGTVTYTVANSAAIDPVMLSVNPQFMGSNTITVPTPAVTPPQTPKPTVDISLIGTPDETAKTFRVRLDFSDTVALVPANVMVQKEDPADPTAKVAALVPAVTLTQLGTGETWVAEVDYSFESLPLYVSVASGVVSAMTPTDGLMVGSSGTTPGVPANAPDAPTSLTATADQAANTIMLSWMAPVNTGGSAITGYRVKKTYTPTGGTLMTKYIPSATGALPVTPTSVTIPGASDPALPQGVEFTFTVVAINVNGAGAESNMAMATIDVDPVVRPGLPSWLGAHIGDVYFWVGEVGHKSPNFPQATDILQYPVDDTGYSVDPTLPAGLELRHIGDNNRFITGTPTIAQAKTSYNFIYEAPDGVKIESPFTITIVQRLAPGKLMGLTAEQNSHVPDAESVDLSWDALAVRKKTDANNTGNDGGSPVTHYEISWTGPNSGSMSTSGEDDPDALMYTLMQDLAIGEYMFKVRAVNAIGMGAYSDAVTVNIANPPGAPRDLDASLEQVSNRVTLQWLAPTNDGGDAISGYVVYIWAPGSTEPTRHPTNSTATTHRTDTLTVEGRYSFRVAAMNGCGEGPMSLKDDADVDILVNRPPVFQVGASISDITATVGTSISVPLPTASDPEGERVLYGVTPTLPAGLNLTLLGGNPVVTGTPTAVMSRTLYSFIAADVAPAVSDPTVSTLTFYITVNPQKMPTIDIPTATSSSAPISLGPQFADTMIPAYGFAVLVRDVQDSGTYDPLPNTWNRSMSTSLPDLAWFFGGTGGTNGGTIALHGPATAKDLLISEIMWGTDSSLAMPSCSQWIEFYNATPNPIDLSNFTITFHRSQVPAAAWAGAVDVVSNAGRIYFGHSEFPGQSGRTNPVDTQGRYAATVNLISMFRDIDHVWVQHHNVANRGERNKRIGGWLEAMYPTANIHAGRVATPGAEQIRRVTIANTTFSRDIIINEIGNSANDDYDWIELHNTTSAAIKLRKWDFTMIVKEGDVGKEKRIFQFPDNDTVWVPANGYLVIARTHPRNDGNDLAAGIDVTKSAIDQLKRGLGEKDLANHPTAYYYVNSGLVIPNDTNRRLFVLRNANDKHGQPTHVVDAAGTLSIEVRGELQDGFTGYVAHTRQLWNTATWPFQGAAGVHGDVITDGPPENFRPGHVYQRNGKNSGIGEHHISVRGYTGIGYDRHAAVNGENGGTPGYSKDAVKSKASDLAGMITISEIMLATDELETAGRVPRATRLPQWIEIYNSSLTQSVNLKNWYIEIQNADSDDLPETRNLSETVRLTAADVYLQPNQTVLIVSSSGLASDDFPGQRVINLFTTAAYRNALNLKTRGNPVLSQVGFWVQLRDAENNMVDTIGNLAVSRRTGQGRRDNFDTDWDLTFDAISPVSEAPTIRAGESMLHSADGQRSSLIRVYDNKTAADGLLKSSWRSASETNFRNVPSLTFYGNHRDFGTPGYRGGGPLPVSLSKFRPERLESGDVVIRWTTESELNNAGFNILRSETRTGEYKQVNTQLIKGQGTTSERTTYTHIDTSAKPNVVYYYQIQDVSIDGKVQTLQMSRLKGNVTPAGKATTTWGELKALQ